MKKKMFGLKLGLDKDYTANDLVDEAVKGVNNVVKDTAKIVPKKKRK
jgi:hypothetical protein